MGGGLIQLVAYGAQDVYLTGNPQITFFKVVYRRHTNFAMESIEQSYTGIADFDKIINVTVSRNGDLLSSIFLEIDWTDASAVSAWRLGYQIIDYVEVEIGGQIIDKQYGEWMDLWCQLSNSDMAMEKLSRLLNGDLLNKSGNSKTYTPLQFWFCRNYGLALPLIALQYHEVKLNIKFNKNYVFANSANNQRYILSSSSSSLMKNIQIYCDYIFLDTDERRRFAQVSHEYLIEQVQYSNPLKLNTQTNNDVSLKFNHPVKELIVTLKRNIQSGEDVIHPFDYWAVNNAANSFNIDLMTDMVLQLNGQDRFKRRDASYFRCVQPYQFHTGGNKQNGSKSVVLDPTTGNYLKEPFGGFYIYSFAIKPEEHQPSGTCNFSRIDNTNLNFSVNNQADIVKVWAVNYNVLRIMSGMGGLAYSN